MDELQVVDQEPRSIVIRFGGTYVILSVLANGSFYGEISTNRENELRYLDQTSSGSLPFLVSPKKQEEVDEADQAG